jgi:hypothetical protein
MPFGDPELGTFQPLQVYYDRMTDAQREGFEVYCRVKSSGLRNWQERVGREVGKSPSTVRNWSEICQWPKLFESGKYWSDRMLDAVDPEWPPRVRRVFLDFEALGPGRTLPQLLDKYLEDPENGVGITALKTLQEISYKYKFADKLAQRERAVLVASEAAGIVPRMDRKARRLSEIDRANEVLQRVVGKAQDLIDSGELDRIADTNPTHFFEKILPPILKALPLINKEERLETGEVTDRTQQDFSLLIDKLPLSQEEKAALIVELEARDRQLSLPKGAIDAEFTETEEAQDG